MRAGAGLTTGEGAGRGGGNGGDEGRGGGGREGRAGEATLQICVRAFPGNVIMVACTLKHTFQANVSSQYNCETSYKLSSNFFLPTH